MSGRTAIRLRASAAIVAISVALMLGGCNKDAQTESDMSAAATPDGAVAPVNGEGAARAETDGATQPGDAAAEPPVARPSSDVAAQPVPDGPPRRYHYYPHHEVFYDVQAHRYTWYAKGVWNSAAALPIAIKLNPANALIISLPGDKPELSITQAHRTARSKGLVPGQSLGAGGAAPDNVGAAPSQPAPSQPAEPQPVAPPQPEPTAPPQRKSLF
ncbi:MAG: hypothetical protein GC159_04700 [Phycisphaera sp.]|nr:hypothetical protein [Phycisphaera sp.]